MTTDPASVLYDHPTSKPTQAAPAAPARPAQPETATDGAQALDDAQEAARRETAMADALFDGGRPVDAGQADSLLGGPFDPLLTQARMNRDEEAVGLLSEGRKQVAALLVEDGIGQPIVKDLVAQFSDWHARESMTDDAVDALNERTMKSLRQSWGSQTQRNIAQAQAYLNKATSRMPWISDALAKGLGSQEGFIKAVYAASRSAARAASKRGSA